MNKRVLEIVAIGIVAFLSIALISYASGPPAGIPPTPQEQIPGQSDSNNVYMAQYYQSNGTIVNLVVFHSDQPVTVDQQSGLAIQNVTADSNRASFVSDTVAGNIHLWTINLTTHVLQHV